jgi:hypothetical protein
VVAEVEQMGADTSGMSGDELERLTELENILRPDPSERKSIRGLSEEETETLWGSPKGTGDEVVDYWQYRQSKGLPIDMDSRKVPPRSEWDD